MSKKLEERADRMAQSNEPNGGTYPRTECAFRIRENGRESTAWRPLFFEISDATGNHWRPFRDSLLEGVDGTEIRAGFLGALWPYEEAWKLRVEFKQVADFPAKELLRIESIPILGPEEMLSLAAPTTGHSSDRQRVSRAGRKRNH